MKKSFALISSLVIAVLILFSSAHAEESQIVVSATGTVSVKPDMAGFTIVLTSLGGNAEKASSEIAERYRSVQQALRTAGIAPDDATSASFSVAPEFVWDQAGARNVLKGYQARHVITVTVRDLRMVGKAIDAVIHAGANDIQNVQVFFRSP